MQVQRYKSGITFLRRLAIYKVQPSGLLQVLWPDTGLQLSEGGGSEALHCMPQVELYVSAKFRVLTSACLRQNS